MGDIKDNDNLRKHYLEQKNKFAINCSISGAITIGLWITLFVLPLTLKYAELHNLKTFNIMKFILRTAYIVCVAGVVLYISHYFKVTFYGSWKDFLFLVTAFLCFYGLLDYGSNSKNEAIS